MEQTIKNMELIIESINIELAEGNYVASKTMMNTYGTLLEKFESLKFHDSRFVEYVATLIAQKNKLAIISIKIEDEVQNKLSGRNYKDADTLVETNRRIERAKNRIENLIYSRKISKDIEAFNKKNG